MPAVNVHLTKSTNEREGKLQQKLAINFALFMLQLTYGKEALGYFF